MALPGLFVEYLVIGSLALLWALPLTGVDLESNDLVTIKIAALAPAIYVLGMFVDFIAFLFVTGVPFRNGSYKARVRRIAQLRAGIDKDAGEPRPVRSAEEPRPTGRPMIRDYRRVIWGGFPEGETEANEFKSSTSLRQIRLAAEKPDLARQVEMRSSRDRIARSSVINLALVGVIHFASHPGLATLSLLLALATIPMWIFFEGNSYGYELRALSELDHRNKVD